MTGSNVIARTEVSIEKAVGEANAAVGGLTGFQYYMKAEKNTVQSEIRMHNTLDAEKGIESVGSVVGKQDAFWTLQILQYTSLPPAKPAVTLPGTPVARKLLKP